MDPYDGNTISVEGLGKATLVRLSGEWDSYVADELAEAFERIEGCDVLVDMRKVSFFDSSALSQLLRLFKRAKRDGYSVMTVSSLPVLRILRATSLDALLEVPPERIAWLAAKARSSRLPARKRAVIRDDQALSS
jgi:anti-anti-sigma factor